MALLGKRDGSVRSAHLGNMIRLFFFAYHLRWVYITKTHTGLQNIQKKNTQQLHVAEISLHKAIPFSIQHLYCLKNNNIISRTKLNLSLFQNKCFTIQHFLVHMRVIGTVTKICALYFFGLNTIFMNLVTTLVGGKG